MHSDVKNAFSQSPQYICVHQHDDRNTDLSGKLTEIYGTANTNHSRKRRCGFLFIKLTIIHCLCASWSWQQSSRAVGVVLRIPGGRMQAWSLLRSGTLTHSNEVQRERDCLLCSHPRAGQGRASGEEGSRARTRWGWREGRSVVAMVWNDRGRPRVVKPFGPIYHSYKMSLFALIYVIIYITYGYIYISPPMVSSSVSASGGHQLQIRGLHNLFPLMFKKGQSCMHPC